MMLRAIVVSALATLGLTGCGTYVTYGQLNRPPHASTPRESPLDVEVFVSRTPPRPYVEVYSLNGEKQTEYSQANRDDMVASMRVKAASLGCDGLVVGDVTRADATATSTGATAKVGGLSAVCIMYR
jgi:hypothetical protein